MRRAVLSTALLHALIGFSSPAQAQHYEPALPPGAVYGQGCYWFRGKLFCNRYCYLEVDGYHYCQRRLHDAGSQAPQPVVVVPPPHWHAPYARRWHGPPPTAHRQSPRP